MNMEHPDTTIGPGLIPVYGGGWYNVLKPNPEVLTLYAIAHHLSHINRFGGATHYPYSVCRHSCHTHDAVAEPELKWEALMHDAIEAVIGDMVKPLKVCVDGYDEIERDNDGALREHYRLPREISRPVKVADIRVFAAEWRDLMEPTHGPRILPAGYEAVDWRITTHDPMQDRGAFLSRYFALEQGGLAPKGLI